MKQPFHHRLLNDPFGDPCLFLRSSLERRAMLFDLGDITALSATELYRVTDVFVTHTHLDHFIGFDTLLRAVLRRDLPLNIYGPAGIIGNIEGKLKGYTWNLISGCPTTINVTGFDGRNTTKTVFRAGNRFRKEPISKQPSDGLLLETSFFRVSAIKLWHGTPCIAYRLDCNEQININKDRLLKKGLSVGPWLTEFKIRLKERGAKGVISVDGKRIKIGYLLDIATISRGPSLSYATDIAINRSNLRSLSTFAKDSDFFFCEAYFLEKDRQRALERFHLTAAECGRIARSAAVKKLCLMHFSPKYMDSPQLLIDEAETKFRGEVVCRPFRP